MKKITSLVIMILLVSLVIAIGVLDRSIKVSKEQKTALESINLDYYTITDYEIGTEEIERCLYKESSINSCQRFNTWWMNITHNETTGEIINEEKVYYTSEEMLNIMNVWEEKRLEDIADATIERQTKADKTEVSGGTTTIIDK